MSGPPDQEEADRPHHDDEYCTGSQPPGDQRIRQLSGHHHDHQQGHHESGFQYQRQRCGQVGQGFTRARACGVENSQHHSLDRDTTEDVAHGYVDVMGQRRAGGDGDLRQVRRDRQQDHPAECGTEMPALREHVGRLRQLDPGDPDDGRGGDENGHQCQ